VKTTSTPSIHHYQSVSQREGKIFRLAEGHDIPSYQGDGEQYPGSLIKKPVKLLSGPCGTGTNLLEFKTYRWREHVGPYYDNDLGYRTEKEF
jgi:pyruvate dehydrogenase E1 component alpha subunit